LRNEFSGITQDIIGREFRRGCAKAVIGWNPSTGEIDGPIRCPQFQHYCLSLTGDDGDWQKQGIWPCQYAHYLMATAAA
jgi:hypothetical protein